MKGKQNIEWKDSWRDEYLKWVCGLVKSVRTVQRLRSTLVIQDKLRYVGPAQGGHWEVSK
jgi:hypothetical protein